MDALPYPDSRSLEVTMVNFTRKRRVRCGLAAGAALLLTSMPALYGQTKTLAPGTRFFIPAPPDGAVQQVESLLKQGQFKNALLIAAMETVPQAVWLTSGTPAQVSATMASESQGSKSPARHARLRALQHSWPRLRQLLCGRRTRIPRTTRLGLMPLQRRSAVRKP